MGFVTDSDVSVDPSTWNKIIWQYKKLMKQSVSHSPLYATLFISKTNIILPSGSKAMLSTQKQSSDLHIIHMIQGIQKAHTVHNIQTYFYSCSTPNQRNPPFTIDRYTKPTHSNTRFDFRWPPRTIAELPPGLADTSVLHCCCWQWYRC